MKKELLIPEKNFNPHERTINFLHSYNMGDLIYSLPAMRKAYRTHGVKIRLLLGLNKIGHYYDGAVHPLGDKMFTKQSFDMALPLLERLEFISSIEVWDGQCKIDYNIDEIRDHTSALGMPHTEIRHWAMFLFPELACDISEPWLPSNRLGGEDFIVVNITQRYRNKNISYNFLQESLANVVFIGVLDEYSLFLKQCRKAQYVKTKDYLEVAGIINASKLFIGNQSSCFAVAEGMGHPRLLEICKEATNVVPATPNGIGYIDQKALEYLVNEAIK